jgi:hypothetical protein
MVDDGKDRSGGGYAHAVRVEEAGRAAVNGVYMLSNQLDPVKNSLALVNGTVSIANFQSRSALCSFRFKMRSSLPGTNNDIDFYSARLSLEDPGNRPETGWKVGAAGVGEEPVPIIVHSETIPKQVSSTYMYMLFSEKFSHIKFVCP